MKKIGTLFYTLSSVCLLAFVILTIQHKHQFAGILLMFVFVFIAAAFRSHKFLKSLSFTVIIFAAVSVAMYYPKYFSSIGSFKLSALIVPLLQIIMFGMGTELSLKDFANVLKMPKGIIAGIVCHYTIMPLVGFA